MKKLSVLLVVLFAMTAGEAFAFDWSSESSVQIYFAIPFGGPTRAEAMPRLGFNVGYGRDFVGYTGHDDDSATFGRRSALGAEPITLPRGSFDFRLGIDGATDLYVNGRNVGERLNALNLEENIWEGWVIPLAVVGAGIGIFAIAKGVN